MNQEETRTGDRNRALAYMMKNDAEEHQVRGDGGCGAARGAGNHGYLRLITSA